MFDLRKTEQAASANGRGDLRRRTYGGGKIQLRGADSLADPAQSAMAAGLRYISDTVRRQANRPNQRTGAD